MKLAESYLINLTLNEFDMAAVEVVLTNESYVILGRDILNQFHITLDGPNLRVRQSSCIIIGR
jgi:hypothetical protein